MLEIKNLTKRFKKVIAVDNMSFSAADGEILALLGPNGAGKTTILRSISGIIQPNSGEIVINGYNLSANEQRAKQNLAFVPETPNLFDMLTVSEHIRFMAQAYNTMDDFDKRSQDLLEKFDLVEKKDELVLTLSKGMKQKLAVICAFIHNARVLLFDEPLIGIDPKGARSLKDMIIEARDNGCTIIVSTHMLDTAEHLCDRMLIIDKGVKVAEGSLQEIHNRLQMGSDASLEDMFLKLTSKENNDEGNTL